MTQQPFTQEQNQLIDEATTQIVLSRICKWRTMSELADQAGMSRQLLTYHAKRRADRILEWQPGLSFWLNRTLLKIVKGASQSAIHPDSTSRNNRNVNQRQYDTPEEVKEQ